MPYLNIFGFLGSLNMTTYFCHVIHINKVKVCFSISSCLVVPDSLKPNPSVPSGPILTLNLPVTSATTTSNGECSPCNALQQKLPQLQQLSPWYVSREVPRWFLLQEQRQLLKKSQPLPIGAHNTNSTCFPPETPTSKQLMGENLLFICWLFYLSFHFKPVNKDELLYFFVICPLTREMWLLFITQLGCMGVEGHWFKDQGWDCVPHPAMRFSTKLGIDLLSLILSLRSWEEHS